MINFEKYKEFMESEEGKKSLDDWFKKYEIKQNIQDRHIEKFKSLYENNLDFIIEKLMEKYYSDEYCLRERKLGYESREELFWLILDYARKYCKICKNQKYWNMFTGEAYYIGSYVIQVMYGQGSAIRIDKKK